MTRITTKLGNMRKPQDFIVYPIEEGKDVIVQSDYAIGKFNPITRVGVLNCKGKTYKYFLHLNKMLGAEDYVFPTDFVQQALAAAPKSGDKVGQVIVIG